MNKNNSYGKDKTQITGDWCMLGYCRKTRKHVRFWQKKAYD